MTNPKCVPVVSVCLLIMDVGMPWEPSKAAGADPSCRQGHLMNSWLALADDWALAAGNSPGPHAQVSSKQGRHASCGSLSFGIGLGSRAGRHLGSGQTPASQVSLPRVMTPPSGSSSSTGVVAIIHIAYKTCWG